MKKYRDSVYKVTFGASVFNRCSKNQKKSPKKGTFKNDQKNEAEESKKRLFWNTVL
jgi:hypothetical protein